MKPVRFDGMTWPIPEGSDEWTLRYGNDADVLRIRLSSASIVAAYRELLQMPKRRREEVIAGIRAALTSTTPGTPTGTGEGT